MSILQQPVLLPSAATDSLLGPVLVLFCIGVATAFTLALFRSRRKRPICSDSGLIDRRDQLRPPVESTSTVAAVCPRGSRESPVNAVTGWVLTHARAG